MDIQRLILILNNYLDHLTGQKNSAEMRGDVSDVLRFETELDQTRTTISGLKSLSFA
jgi:hypothetical protein